MHPVTSLTLKTIKHYCFHPPAFKYVVLKTHSSVTSNPAGDCIGLRVCVCASSYGFTLIKTADCTPLIVHLSILGQNPQGETAGKVTVGLYKDLHHSGGSVTAKI